jgi:hypothetical protein
MCDISGSHTPTEFCRLEKMSRAQLYKLWKRGQGPGYYLVGTGATHRRITEAQRRKWQEDREAAVTANPETPKSA